MKSLLSLSPASRRRRPPLTCCSRSKPHVQLAPATSAHSSSDETSATVTNAALANPLANLSSSLLYTTSPSLRLHMNMDFLEDLQFDENISHLTWPRKKLLSEIVLGFAWITQLFDSCVSDGKSC